MPFTPITVTKSWENPDGSEATGSVTFTLSSQMTDTSTGESVAVETITATLAAGSISQTLLANDDETTIPPGTTYTVVETIDGGATLTYPITVPSAAAGGTATLASLRS
jgi:hypothetical protein